jgi:hypothetical protein
VVNLKKTVRSSLHQHKRQGQRLPTSSRSCALYSDLMFRLENHLIAQVQNKEGDSESIELIGAHCPTQTLDQTKE